MVDRACAEAKVFHHNVIHEEPLRIDSRDGDLVTAMFLVNRRGRCGEFELSVGDTVFAGEGPVFFEGAGELLLITVAHRN